MTKFETYAPENLSDTQKLKWYEDRLNGPVDKWEADNPEDLSPEALKIRCDHYRKELEKRKIVLGHEQQQVTIGAANAVSKPGSGRV